MERRISWENICDIYGIKVNKELLYYFFRNWVNIQSIIFIGRGKKYLIGKNNDNNCIKHSPNTSENCRDKCMIYNIGKTARKCISKERLKVYPSNFLNNQQHRINSKNHEKRYIIIKKKKSGNNISYCFLQDIDKSDLYIIFGVGEVIYTKDDLYSEEILKILDDIATNILQILSEKSLKNIILCGHSFGCVLAQIIGILLIKKNIEFINYLWIIGSAPFLWLREEDRGNYQAFVEANRIIIFGIYYRLFDHELAGQIIKDKFLFEGCAELENPKILVLLEKMQITDIAEISGFTLNLDELLYKNNNSKNNKESISEIKKNNESFMFWLLDYIHHWRTYEQCLRHIF